MSKQYEIVVPFSGFYESRHSGHLEAVIEDTLPEDGWPDMTYIDTKGFYAEYAEAYVAAVVTFLEAECSITLGLKFKEVNSPREYNFETDQIIAYISEEGIKQLLYNTDWTSLGESIAKELAPRSGFSTWRSNNLDDWFFRGVSDWDCIELGFLLEQFVIMEDIEVDLGHEIASNHITYRDGT